MPLVPPPRDEIQMQFLTGMCTQYRNHIPYLQIIIKALYRFTWKAANFPWGQEQRAAIATVTLLWACRADQYWTRWYPNYEYNIISAVLDMAFSLQNDFQDHSQMPMSVFKEQNMIVLIPFPETSPMDSCAGSFHYLETNVDKSSRKKYQLRNCLQHTDLS